MSIATIPVLIIGAGPCGLTAAAFLTHYGIPCRIIDKKVGPTQTSNAVGVHARVLELFEEIGITDQLLQLGQEINYGNLFVHKKQLATVHLSHIQSKYAFVCDIPQNSTEHCLLTYLKSHQLSVDYGVQAISIKQDADCVHVLCDTAGNQETITASWVIAADGYHSLVREQLGIPYLGNEYGFKFKMIDAPIACKHIKNNFVIAMAEDISLMIFPMQHSARMIAEISQAPQYDDATPDEVLFQTFAHKTLPYPVEIKKPLWSSQFYVHERLASSYQKQRIFLVGDAAHVHIPAAAQGMNTGMQDAMNLAWKLAATWKHKLDHHLLDTYHAERHPVGESVLSLTDKMGRGALTKNKILDCVRSFMLPKLSKFTFLQRKLVNQIAQLNVHYRDSPLVQGKTLKILRAGDRIAELPIPQLQGKHLILDFSGQLSETLISKDYAIIYRVTAQDRTRMPEWSTIQAGYCVVRPDRYIGYVGTCTQDVEKYFKTVYSFNA